MVIPNRSVYRLCDKVFSTFPLISLILTISSVKMIGLFVTALVGVYIIEDLWEKFGDVKMPLVRPFFEHVTQR